MPIDCGRTHVFRFSSPLPHAEIFTVNVSDHAALDVIVSILGRNEPRQLCSIEQCLPTGITGKTDHGRLQCLARGGIQFRVYSPWQVGHRSGFGEVAHFAHINRTFNRFQADNDIADPARVGLFQVG